MNSHLFLCNRNSHHYSIYPFQLFGGQLEAINNHDTSVHQKRRGMYKTRPISILWKHKKHIQDLKWVFCQNIFSNFALKLMQLIILTENRFCIKLIRPDVEHIPKKKTWKNTIKPCMRERSTLDYSYTKKR